MSEYVKDTIKAVTESAEDLNRVLDTERCSSSTTCNFTCPKAECCFNICKSFVINVCE